MQYDSSCEYSRQHLAISISSRLSDAGFVRTETHTQHLARPALAEHVYERDIEGTDLKIQVYTTVVLHPDLGLQVRATGKDAIRINVRAPDADRPIITETRVNRTGVCDVIVERVIERARDAYRLGKQAGKCHKCDATRAMSKNGKWYCSAVCWKTVSEKAQDKSEWRRKNYKPRRRFGYRYR